MPLEASRARPVDGASIVRRLSLWLTRFSCVLVIDRKKLWFPWPFWKRKINCVCTFSSCPPATFSESAKLSCACPIFRHEKFTDPTRYNVSAQRIFRLCTIHSLAPIKATLELKRHQKVENIQLIRNFVHEFTVTGFARDVFFLHSI